MERERIMISVGSVEGIEIIRTDLVKGVGRNPDLKVIVVKTLKGAKVHYLLSSDKLPYTVRKQIETARFFMSDSIKPRREEGIGHGWDKIDETCEGVWQLTVYETGCLLKIHHIPCVGDEYTLYVEEEFYNRRVKAIVGNQYGKHPKMSEIADSYRSLFEKKVENTSTQPSPPSAKNLDKKIRKMQKAGTDPEQIIAAKKELESQKGQTVSNDIPVESNETEQTGTVASDTSCIPELLSESTTDSDESLDNSIEVQQVEDVSFKPDGTASTLEEEIAMSRRRLDNSVETLCQLSELTSKLWKDHANEKDHYDDLIKRRDALNSQK